MNKYYLNTASQTPIKNEVLETIMYTLKYHWYNPSDKFSYGVESHQILESAKKNIADSINAEINNIVICASGSMANNLAINGFCYNKSSMLITTNIEHSSIRDINHKYYKMLEVCKNGIIEPSELEHDLSHNNYNSFIVSMQYVNNEIGTIQPIKELIDITHKYGGVFHCDATQYYPYYKIDVKKLNVDMLTVSGHKIGLPAGIAFLYVKDRSILKPLVYGEQDSLLAGTENLAYINGMSKAIDMIDYSKTKHIENLRNYFEELVLKTIKDTYVNGSIQNRACHISNICFKGCDAETMQLLLDNDGIICSTGSACNSNNKEPSFVMKAIGVDEPDNLSCLRFSFGSNLTFSDIDYIVSKLRYRVDFLRNMNMDILL